jgi:hypothetical protein
LDWTVPTSLFSIISSIVSLVSSRRESCFGGDFPSAVMAGHSRSKNGVASLAYVPAIHVFAKGQKRGCPGARPGMTPNGQF